MNPLQLWYSYNFDHASVAQLDRAPVFEIVGWEFESLQRPQAPVYTLTLLKCVIARYDSSTVHWIYRKAPFTSDLRNHKGRDANLSKWKSTWTG